MKGGSTVPEKRKVCVCVCVFYRNYSMNIYFTPLKYDAT